MKNITLALGDGDTKTVECLEASDGFHTFDQLYDHRVTLFVALLKAHQNYPTYKTEPDGGWFVAGILSPAGQIGYHLPESVYALIEANSEAPEWDGHTADDALERLASL